MCLSKSIECTPRVNPNTNHGLWEIMMCHCSFIDCNKCPALAGHVGSEGVCASAGAGGICKISALPAQFCCGPKTAL